MSTLKILLFPDPRLRTKAVEIKSVNDEIKKLAKDMIETMHQGNGIGLAATQVNVHKRLIVVDVGGDQKKPLVLINPRVKEILEPELTPYSEGCLSVPGFYEELERPKKVKISAIGLKNEEIELDADGVLAVVIQHEIDHLDGKMMVDFLSNLKRERIRKKLLKQKKEAAN